MRALRTVLMVAASLSLAGCSIVNRPDDPPEPRDAGPDADSMIDAPEDDVNQDAGIEICDDLEDADEDGDGRSNCEDIEDCEGMECSETAGTCVCRNGRAVELNCGNGTDDDRDGTTDCGDFDCAEQSLAICCGGGDTPAHWPNPDMICPLSGWVQHGAGEVSCESETITEFDDTEPFSIVWDDCLSFALGATIEASVKPLGPTGNCREDDRCDEHVKILIAERDVPRTNGLFFADLALVVHASGLLELTQGDAPIESATLDLVPLPENGDHDVRIELRPDVSEEGVPELRARVFVDPFGPDLPEAELWEGFVLPLDQLIVDGECREVPGLYFAIEGQGGEVPISNLALGQSECANPNLFRPSLDVLTPYDYGDPGSNTSLELDPQRLIDEPARRDEPSWATQALSSPSLLFSSSRWRVAAEASNDQPANEPSFRVGYAVAYRDNTTWNELDGWDGGRDTPWIGNQPPSCLDMSCTDPFSPEMPPYPSVRDPFLFRLPVGTVAIAFAAEVPVEAEPRSERFGIHVTTLNAFMDDSSVDESTLVLAPSRLDECDSVRDPVVTQRPGGSDGDYWLFFTCYAGLTSRGIWAIPLINSVGFEIANDGGSIFADARQVLAPGDVNFGRGTLRSPELLVDEGATDDDAVFAMWFLVGQEVGLAIGEGKSEFPSERWTTGDVPVLQLFEGNPVLRPSDRAFNFGCAGCSIEGLAVARTEDDSVIRFLIARENDDTPARYDLLPLDQTWRNLARP